MHTRTYTAVLMALVLAACGGGGSSVDTPSDRPVGTVEGRSYDGLLTNAEIRVYSVDDELGRDELLGSTRSDADGNYSLELTVPWTDTERPVLVRATGGQYTEEASGKTVQLSEGQALTALVPYEAGSRLEVMVTPFTHLATARARHEVANGATPSKAAIESAVGVSSYTGVNILSVRPRDVTDEQYAASGLSPGLRYGYLAAGISQWTADLAGELDQAPHDRITSIALAQLMYDDVVADGELDGQGRDGALGFGSAQVGADTYRADFGRHMLKFAAENARNNASVSRPSLLPDARSMAKADGPLFPDDNEPAPLDEQGPEVSRVNPAGKLYTGQLRFPIDVSDATGIDSIRYAVDGTGLGLESDLSDPALELATGGYSDGEHELTVTATDVQGNTSTATFEVAWYNDGPAVSLTSPAHTSNSRYVAKGAWRTERASIDAVTVNGKQATINDDGTWRVTLELSGGSNPIDVVARDVLGNTTEATFSVGLDRQAPAVELGNVGAQASTFPYSDGSGQKFRDYLRAQWTHADGIALHYPLERVALSSLAVTRTNLDNNDYPYVMIAAEDPSGASQVSTDRDELELYMSYSRGRNTLIEDRPIDGAWLEDHGASSGGGGLTKIVPLVAEVLGDDWYQVTPDTDHVVTFTAVDRAGNRSTKTLTFRTRAVAAEPEVTTSSSDDDPTRGVDWSKRASIDGARVTVRTIEWTNPHNDAVWISLDNPNASVEATNTVETAEAYHTATKIKKKQYRARVLTASFENVQVSDGGCSIYCPNEYELACNIGYDGYKRIDGGTVYQYEIGSFNNNTHELESGRSEVASERTQDPDSYDTHGDYSAWRTSGPSPEDWSLSPRSGGYNAATDDYDHSWEWSLHMSNIGYIAWRDLHSLPCRDGHGGAPDSTGGSSLQVRQKTYWEVSDRKTDRGTLAVTASSSDAGTIVATESRGRIAANAERYYQILPGERVIIRQTVRLPNRLRHYDNTAVAGDYTDYETGQYDQAIEWDAEASGMVAVYPNVRARNVPDMVPATADTDTVNHTYTIGR
jgi:hypothetical protein